MNKSAVLHIPMSQYAFPLSEDAFTIRLRAGREDLDSCLLFWGDRACVSSPVRFSSAPMEVRFQDSLFEFYEITLMPCPRRICYYFQLTKGTEQLYYYAGTFHTDLPDLIMEDGFVVEGRSEYDQYPYILRSEIPALPEWFLHAAVYNIFPDSFADGPCRLSGRGKELTLPDKTKSRSKLGGTLRGILENLDYIQDLGFNCLYLNPIFHAEEYHKYDIVDYFHVDPCLGSDQDFLALTDALHSRGMRIIIDGVFNHCSWHFPPFEDVVRKGADSSYRDWFYDLTFPLIRPETESETPPYACFAYERKMPKLNTSNPQVQEYFARVGQYWIENFHVDGWRLDVANEVDKNFWRRFRHAVREANPQAVLIGEVWENAEIWLKGDLFDSVMNYDFRKHCRDHFALGKTTAGEFAQSMTDMFLRYPVQVSHGQLNLLDSHDVARFYTLCGEDLDKWQCAFLCLCMMPGVPSVFYGDEQQISGLREHEYRSAMPWHQLREENSAFVRKVLQIRKDWIAPMDQWRILPDTFKSPLLIFERTGRHRIRILIHSGSSPAEVLPFCQEGKVLLAKNATGTQLAPKGFLVLLMP